MTDSAPKQEPPYGLRMPPDLKDRVKQAAAANNRSMNAEIVATLEEKYPAPDMASEINASIEYFRKVYPSLSPDARANLVKGLVSSWIATIPKLEEHFGTFTDWIRDIDFHDETFPVDLEVQPEGTENFSIRLNKRKHLRD